MKPTGDEIRNRLSYRPPTDVTKPMHEEVNKLCIDLALNLVHILPEGRNLSICLTLIEDLRMRANSAIAQDLKEVDSTR